MATTASFTIGEAFPADDPIARFVTVLAIISNDNVRAVRELEAAQGDSGEARARRVRLFRLMTASHFEAVDFITNARKWYPAEIERLLAAPKAQEALTAVLAPHDAQSEGYVGDWLKRHRNVTFHYPKVQPDAARNDREEIQQALRAAADVDGEIINGDVLVECLFPFTDEVVAQWMPSEAELEGLARAPLALVRFAHIAMREYLKTLPDGVLTVEHR